LKTDFTQSVEDAVDQYRFDRLPRSKGNPAEPLLSFPSGALVPLRSEQHRSSHDDQASGGHALPSFQQGQRWRAGNPLTGLAVIAQPISGRGVGARKLAGDLGRYLVAEKDSKKQITNVIFRAITSLMPPANYLLRCMWTARAANI